MTGARRAGLRPEVEQFLAVLDEGFPDVTQYTGGELREAIRSRRGPLERLPDMAVAEDVSIDGPGGPLPLRVFVPHGDATDTARPLIVYAHGGGFVFCDLDTHDEFCRATAESVGAVVVSVDYRLAPEHRAPAALDDMYAAVCWAHEHAARYGADPARIAVAGDSAGGNLAATVSIAARDRGGPPLAGQVLLYPVIDDDFGTESYRLYGEGYYNSEKAMRWYWEQYAPSEADRSSPYVVPTRAESLAGLPPAVVVTAELDPPCVSGERYADALAAAGVPVTARRFDGLFHGFLTFPQFVLTGPAREDVWTMMRKLLG